MIRNFIKWLRKGIRTTSKEEVSSEYTKTGKCWHNGRFAAIDILPNGQIIVTEMKVNKDNWGKSGWVTSETFIDNDVLCLKEVDSCNISMSMEYALGQHVSYLVRRSKELSEKKIELTESQFDEILRFIPTDKNGSAVSIEQLKQKLFGE